MINLLRCPFCNGEAGVFVVDGVMVKCMNCGCRTVRLDDRDKTYDAKFAIDKVVSSWNRRPRPIETEEFEGTYYCKNCGEPVQKLDNYCHSCGKELKWSGEVQ